MASTFSLLPLEMKLSNNMIEATKRPVYSKESGIDLAALASKVAMVAIIPFALIYAAEAIVVFGLGSLANMAISVLNAAIERWNAGKEAAPEEAAKTETASETAQTSAPAETVTINKATEESEEAVESEDALEMTTPELLETARDMFTSASARAKNAAANAFEAAKNNLTAAKDAMTGWFSRCKSRITVANQ